MASVPSEEELSEEQQAAREKKANDEKRKLSRAREKAVLTRLMSDRDGREFVWNFLSEFHMFSTSFAVDSHVTAFREGERNVALRFSSMILDAAPGSYMKMMQERSGAKDE